MFKIINSFPPPFVCFQSQFLLSLQAISIMVHFYMGTKGPDNVSTPTQLFHFLYPAKSNGYHITSPERSEQAACNDLRSDVSCV